MLQFIILFYILFEDISGFKTIFWKTFILNSLKAELQPHTFFSLFFFFNHLHPFHQFIIRKRKWHYQIWQVMLFAWFLWFLQLMNSGGVSWWVEKKITLSFFFFQWIWVIDSETILHTTSKTSWKDYNHYNWEGADKEKKDYYNNDDSKMISVRGLRVEKPEGNWKIDDGEKKTTFY